MKKQSASSAFFNIRILLAFLVISAGLFIGLAGTGAFARGPKIVLQKTATSKIVVSSEDPLVPAGFDCSKIQSEHIYRQENLRAGALMIACGEAEGGTPVSGIAKFVQNIKSLFSPDAYGSVDQDAVTGTETSPNIVQSETYTAVNPDNPNQVIVAYNDSRGRNASPINISGASVSTDGGSTFTRLTTGTGQSPFVGTEGDPVVMYHKPSGTWFTVWLDTGCGSQGLGGYKSTTPENPNSWTHFCVHNATNDDRESGWADNNPASPFYGNMYVSWGATAGLVMSRSTDGGLTWSAPLTVAPASPFIRNVQITGDLAGNGDIYIAGMNENGSTTNFNRNNLIFRSTNGGVSWSNTYTGPTFQGPGVTNVGYFACMFTDGGGFWRHEGWGQPAAFNHVVSLVYASRVGAPPADAGDVYYIRSTDSGVTFGAPVKLNTDATTRPQWQPNLSVSPTGSLLATWYDARESASCTRGSAATPCYRMWSRRSNDNGVTWLPDMEFSDVVSPLPAQNDPGIQATYAGDYDYGSAVATKHVTSWVDGRVAIPAGTSQQDAFTDRDLVGFSVTSTNPGCNTIISTQPNDFVVNLTDPVDPASVQGSDFTVNALPANSFVLSNGNATITFHFNASPVTTQGIQTMAMAAGAINKAAGGDPNLAFSCTFRYDAVPLMVTTTNPPVGGNFNGGSQTYDVNFNEAVDPASVSTSDLTLSGVAGSVTGVMVINANMTARFTLNLTSIFSGTLTTNIAAGAITDAFGGPNAAFTGMYSYTSSFCPTLSENFDSVTPPALPAGWTATVGTNTAGAPLWVTSNAGVPAPVADTAPNAAFTQDPSNLCDNRLDSTTLMINSPSATLTFRQNYDLEQSTATVAYDAGVLEISINGGAYQDIVAAGGSFSSGGYNHTSISTGFSNPCNTVAPTHVNTWSGISNGGAGGYETVTLTPPAAAVGQPVKLRWRMCSDNSVSHAGWRVDSLTVYEPCPATVSGAVSRKTHGGAGDFDIALPLSGTPGVEDRAGGATNDYTMVVTFTSNVSVSGSPQAEVIAGTATIGTGGVGNGGAVTVSGNTVTIPLTNVANAQTINVRLNGVNTATDQTLVNVVIPMSRLLGDVNGSGAVNATDVSQTKGRIGQAVDSSNFKSDVNANGAINATDASIIKPNIGTGLP